MEPSVSRVPPVFRADKVDRSRQCLRLRSSPFRGGLVSTEFSKLFTPFYDLVYRQSCRFPPAPFARLRRRTVQERKDFPRDARERRFHANEGRACFRSRIQYRTFPGFTEAPRSNSVQAFAIASTKGFGAKFARCIDNRG